MCSNPGVVNRPKLNEKLIQSIDSNRSIDYRLAQSVIERTRTKPITKITIPISNGNRTEWSPIQSVIIQVITKSDDRAAESDLFITSMITDRIGRHEALLTINHKSYNFREKKNSQVLKERENLH